MHQHGDGIQGVEQKVGMELRAQRLELRLGQLCLQLRRPQFAFAEPGVVARGVDPTQDHPVDTDAQVQVDDGVLQVADEGVGRAYQ